MEIERSTGDYSNSNLTPPPPPRPQFELLHLDCVVPEADYTFKLFTTTMAPLGLVVLALLWEIGYKAVDHSRRIINGSFMKYMMIILYFVLSATRRSL